MTQETQTRKRYTDDFKREAVALITEQVGIQWSVHYSLIPLL